MRVLHNKLTPSCIPLLPCLLQLTLTPTQQLLIQQAQAQILAAAVQQHTASQQNSTTGANISATAATPITQLPLSQPIQITSVSHPPLSFFRRSQRYEHSWHIVCSSAATTAEFRPASVCSGSAWSSHCYFTAAGSVHHLTDTAGPAR